MNDRPRILLLIPHLGGGGAEKVIALLAQNLSGKRYEIHLGIVTRCDAPSPIQFPGVTLHMIGASRVRSSALALLILVWRIRPDAILSGMFHLSFLVLALRPMFPRKTRVIIRQNGTVSTALATGNQPRYNRLLYKLLYRRADAVICQTKSMADDLASATGIARELLIVLPNPVDTDLLRLPSARGQSLWTGPGPHLLAIGRLAREKGFDLLLSALYSLRTQFPEVELVIVGAGAEEASLRAQCRLLGLDDAVSFTGYSENPAQWFAGATSFVLSSRDDAMPNAMLEAAAAGLAIVALPASGGVIGLLRGRPGVWLAPEVSSAALTASLKQALAALRPEQRFAHSFLEPFETTHAIRAYEHAIDAVLETAAQPVAARFEKMQGRAD